MPRKPRKNVDTEFFHVIVQGINKISIFSKTTYIEKFKKLLIDNISKFKVKLLAYCIMSNHAHLLLHSENVSELSKFMQIVNTTYALYYNKKENRVRLRLSK
jgi:REP element-mobilizing transposase RayT